jgi:hypothetical protein
MTAMAAGSTARPRATETSNEAFARALPVALIGPTLVGIALGAAFGTTTTLVASAAKARAAEREAPGLRAACSRSWE